MRILAIESSAKAASCALLRDGALEGMCYQNVGLTHSATLMPMVESMLHNGGLGIGDVDVVAAAHGPGSFTGVRIGVSTALGLAAGADIPAVGVSTLAAMAELVSHTGRVALCAMDARRGEVYGAAFLGGQRLREDCALPADRFAAEVASMAREMGRSIICLGDGAELCMDCLAPDRNSGRTLAPEGDVCYNNCLESDVEAGLAPPHLLRQSAVGVGMLAARLLESGEKLPPLRPVYLRVSQAERERNARLAGGDAK